MADETFPGFGVSEYGETEPPDSDMADPVEWAGAFLAWLAPEYRRAIREAIEADRRADLTDGWERATKAERFLDREGYRMCDTPACNCGSWHRIQTEGK